MNKQIVMINKQPRCSKIYRMMKLSTKLSSHIAKLQTEHVGFLHGLVNTITTMAIQSQIKPKRFPNFMKEKEKLGGQAQSSIGLVLMASKTKHHNMKGLPIFYFSFQTSSALYQKNLNNNNKNKRFLSFDKCFSTFSHIIKLQPFITINHSAHPPIVEMQWPYK